MKRDVELFGRKAYFSGSSGEAQVYVHELAHCLTMGQGELLQVEFIGHNRSASTARARLTFYESTNPTGRPRDSQKQLGPQVVESELRPEFTWVYGPFGSHVECCLEIYDSNSPTAQVFIEAEIRVSVHA